jgi:Fe-S-cluster-containing dehydrogenase component
MNERNCSQGSAEGGETRSLAAQQGQPLPEAAQSMSAGEAYISKRRDFLRGAIMFIPAAGALAAAVGEAPKAETPAAETPKQEYNPADHLYGMGIQIDRCIGCNRCAVACKAENNVPEEPVYFRTWVERYTILRSGEVSVENISGPRKDTVHDERDVIRTFFVPKLCNHCANPPCVQVCPVRATFTTPDGAVIVDSSRCVGCRYCIQACPYGARYLHPKTNTADKCTFCYHRVVKGLQPACVEVCPTQARIFGDLKSKASRLVRFERMNMISVLKPALNTEPKVHYAQLDGEVR